MALSTIDKECNEPPRTRIGERSRPMKRPGLVVLTAVVALGCRSSQPTTNPFLRTTVPPPATGQGAVVVPGEPYTPGAVPPGAAAPAVPIDPSAVPPPSAAPMVAPPPTVP